jgi:hypothetical protein
MPVVVDPSPPPGRLLTLRDFRPSPRSDGIAWSAVRVDQAETPEPKTWKAGVPVLLAPIDEVPAEPALRTFTILVSEPWLRVSFVDLNGNEDASSLLVSASEHPFRPTLPEIAAVLRERTYSGKTVDPDNPMAVLAGGTLVGEFTDATTPTGASVERLITRACKEVARATGPVPGEMIEEARPVAATKAAAEIERAYIPSQANEGATIYQTLRITAAEDIESLVGNLRLWTFANRGIE